jgi:hypothetical protein
MERTTWSPEHGHCCLWSHTVRIDFVLPMTARNRGQSLRLVAPRGRRMVRRVGAHLKCLTALSWTQATLDTPAGDLLDGEMMDLSVEEVHAETTSGQSWSSSHACYNLPQPPPWLCDQRPLPEPPFLSSRTLCEDYLVNCDRRDSRVVGAEFVCILRPARFPKVWVRSCARTTLNDACLILGSYSS